MNMTIYQQIRAAVPIGQAARQYGLTVSQGGMTLCPFHRDTHPSLKLNADYFFSFELPLGFKEAEAYRKANGQYLRKNQWRDTTVTVYIDLD